VVVTDGWRRRVVTTPTTRSCALYGRENSEDETEEQGMQIRARRRRQGSWWRSGGPWWRRDVGRGAEGDSGHDGVLV
jgi:hypothetical protein